MYITLKNLNLDETEAIFIEFENENIKITQDEKNYIINYDSLVCEKKNSIIKNIENLRKRTELYGSLNVDNVKNQEKDCILELELFENLLQHDYFFEDEMLEEHFLTSIGFILEPVIIKNENTDNIFEKYFNENHKNI